jgi:hypothetical protein
MKRIYFLGFLMILYQMSLAQLQGDERCFSVERASLCIGECNSSMIDSYSHMLNDIEESNTTFCLNVKEYDLCSRYTAYVVVTVDGNNVLNTAFNVNSSFSFNASYGSNVSVTIFALESNTGILCKRLGNTLMSITSEN